MRGTINNFDVLKIMGERNMDLRLAPLSNIINLKKVLAGTHVTIGVEGDVVSALGLESRFVGALILADKKQFDLVKAELSKLEPPNDKP